MKNKKAANKKASMSSAQRFLNVSEIKQDTLVMKDGTLRAILMVSSINFALKNEDEQNAIVSAYVGFLNALDHPLQIVIQSRELYIKPYLQDLIKREREQNNELLRTQIADYRSFITQLVEMGEIMSKNFYVVVPYDPLSNKKKSFWSRLSEVFNPAVTIKLKADRFTKRKQDLEQRIRQVESGLRSIGLEVVRLDTQSLVEILYSTYNPDIALTERLGSLNDMQLE